MLVKPRIGLLGILVLYASTAGFGTAEERSERFDRDPGWEGHNNRSTAAPREVRQDFGYSKTAHAGGKLGELGGFITPAAEPAYYAKKLPTKTLDNALSASGTLACTGRQFHALIGFFKADTLNGWRTPNTIALRISGRGDVIYAWLEYCTQRWRAGGDSPQGFPTERDSKSNRLRLKGFAAKGTVHRWTLLYDPKGNEGRGVITATIDDVKAICHLADGHKKDGATFNRFGLLTVMKSAAAGGEVWLDDITVNGDKEDFSSDPGWDALHNRRTYTTRVVRPRFDFGYSSTHYAGGKSAGELGGLVFRGDCRFPEKMAYYADRLDELSLDKPLRASGKVCLRRGVTDSTMLIGFFHSKDSMAVNPSQENGLPSSFFGISTDGPSREGFYFAPAYRVNNKSKAAAQSPRIYPDGTVHDWTLDYSPTAGGGKGEVTVTLGKQSVQLVLVKGCRTSGAKFNRFGLITTWVDGNSQIVYFDDLTYTCKQD